MQEGQIEDPYGTFNRYKRESILKKNVPFEKIVILGPPRSGKTFFINNYIGPGPAEQVIALVSPSNEKTDKTTIFNNLKKISEKLKNIRRDFESELENSGFEGDEITEIKSHFKRPNNIVIDQLKEIRRNGMIPVIYYIPVHDNEKVVEWQGVKYVLPGLTSISNEEFVEQIKIYEEVRKIFRLDDKTIGSILTLDIGQEFLDRIESVALTVANYFRFFTPIISGVFFAGIVLMELNVEKSDIKEFLKMIVKWKNMHEDLRHLVSAELAISLGLSEKDAFDALNTIALNKDELEKKIEDLQKEVNKIRERIKRMELSGASPVTNEDDLKKKIKALSLPEVKLMGEGNEEADMEINEKINEILNFSENGVMITGEPGLGKTTFLYLIGKKILQNNKDLYYIDQIDYFIQIAKYLKENDAYAIADIPDEDAANAFEFRIKSLTAKNEVPRIIITVRDEYIKNIMEYKNGEFTGRLLEYTTFKVYRFQMSRNAILSIAKRHAENIKNYISLENQEIEEIVEKSEGSPLYVNEIFKYIMNNRNVIVNKKLMELLNDLPDGIKNMISKILYDEIKENPGNIVIYYIVSHYPNFPVSIMEYIKQNLTNAQGKYSDLKYGYYIEDGAYMLHSWYKIITDYILSNSNEFYSNLEKIWKNQNEYEEIKRTFQRAANSLFRGEIKSLANQMKSILIGDDKNKNLQDPDCIMNIIILKGFLDLVNSIEDMGFSTDLTEKRLEYENLKDKLYLYVDILSFWLNEWSSIILKYDKKPCFIKSILFYLSRFILWGGLMDEKYLEDILLGNEKIDLFKFTTAPIYEEFDTKFSYIKMLVKTMVDIDQIDDFLDRGNYYICLGEYDRAKDEFKKAMEKCEIDKDKNKVILSKAYLGMGIALIRYYYIDKSIEWLNKAIDLTPENPWNYYYIGINLNIFHDYKKSLEYLKKSIDLNIECTNAYYEYFRDLFFMYKFEESLDGLKLISHKFPQFVYIHIGIAYIYKNTGNYEKAIEEYNEAIKLDPSNHSVYYGKGMTFYEMGCYEEAIKNFNVYQKLLPTDVDCRLQKIKALKRLGNESLALQEINDMLNNLNKSKIFRDYYYWKGEAMYLMGNYVEAINSYEKEINKYNNKYNYYNYVYLYMGLGKSYYKLKNYEKAIESYNKGIDKNEYFLDCYVGKIYALIKLNKFDEALKEADYVYRKFPHIPAVLVPFAMVLAYLKNYEKAMELLKEGVPDGVCATIRDDLEEYFENENNFLKEYYTKNCNVKC